MQPSPPTLVSPVRPQKRRRIWPWLLALLVLSIGVSFAGVMGVLAWAKTRAKAPGAAPVVVDAGAPDVRVAEPTISVALATPGPSVSASATHATVHAGAPPHPTTTTPPPQTAPIGAPIAPSTGTRPMSGTAIMTIAWDGPDCGNVAHEVIDLVKPKASLCFFQFRNEPPVHENVDYVFWVENGEVKRVERKVLSPDVPNMDVCMATAIRTSPMPKAMPSCWAHIGFGAPCKPGWFGQCLADAGP